MIHFTLAHAMVSARSRYHHHRRLVIRQAISSLLLAAPPRVLSFCLLLRCVALLCCSLGQPSSASPLMRATTTATHRPACHRRPAVAHAAYLPRISGAPARSCRRLSLQRTGHKRLLVRAPSAPSSLSVCGACLRRAVRAGRQSGSLQSRSASVFAPTHPPRREHPLNSHRHPPSLSTDHPTLAHNPRPTHAHLPPPSLSSTDPHFPLSQPLCADPPPTTPGLSSKTAPIRPLLCLCSNTTHIHTAATT